MDLFHGSLSAGNPALEMAMASALLRRVSAGTAEPALRVYRPAGPAVAFGRRDLRLPGLAAAAALARDAGFAPVVRAPGGRVVAYTSRALVVDHVSPDPEWPSGLEARFREYGGIWADVLGRLGVDARVGEVPGEYCPGSYSVNARGAVKLVGTAQRMVRGAWLFSAVLMYDDTTTLRPLLTSVHDALGLPFDGETVGSVSDETQDVSLDLLEAAVLAAYDRVLKLEPRALDESLLDEARALVPDHMV